MSLKNKIFSNLDRLQSYFAYDVCNYMQTFELGLEINIKLMELREYLRHFFQELEYLDVMLVHTSMIRPSFLKIQDCDKARKVFDVLVNDIFTVTEYQRGLNPENNQKLELFADEQILKVLLESKHIYVQDIQVDVSLKNSCRILKYTTSETIQVFDKNIEKIESIYNSKK